MSTKFFCDCCEEEFPQAKLKMFIAGSGNAKNRPAKHYCDECLNFLATTGLVIKKSEIQSDLEIIIPLVVDAVGYGADHDDDFDTTFPCKTFRSMDEWLDRPNVKRLNKIQGTSDG